METPRAYTTITPDLLVEQALHGEKKQQVRITAKTIGASDAHIRAQHNLYSRTEDGKNYVKRQIEGVLVGAERNKDGEGITITVEEPQSASGIRWFCYVQVKDILSSEIQK